MGVFTAALLTGCTCVGVWVLSGVAELCLLSLLLLGVGLAVVEPLAGVCFCASSCGSCGFPRSVLPQVTLRGFSYLSGSCCLSCSWSGALSVGFAVSWVRLLAFHLVPCSFSGACGWCSSPCHRLPFGASAFSDTVYLAYCWAGGVGWAATLPLCSRCFSCAGCLAGVHWVLHPVSGSSHWGCDCSLGGSVVVPFGSRFL